MMYFMRKKYTHTFLNIMGNRLYTKGKKLSMDLQCDSLVFNPLYIIIRVIYQGMT